MAEKKRTMSSYSKKQDYVKRLEEAGDISGRTQKEASQEQEIDNVFNDINEKQKSDDKSWIDDVFDMFKKGD